MGLGNLLGGGAAGVENGPDHEPDQWSLEQEDRKVAPVGEDQIQIAAGQRLRLAKRGAPLGSQRLWRRLGLPRSALLLARLQATTDVRVVRPRGEETVGPFLDRCRLDHLVDFGQAPNTEVVERLLRRSYVGDPATVHQDHQVARFDVLERVCDAHDGLAVG